MASKKSTKTRDNSGDSTKPPPPSDFDMGTGAMMGDGSAATSDTSWMSQHKGIVYGGGLALLVVLGYILYKDHGTSTSSTQAASSLPVTDVLGMTPASGNNSAPGSSGYGGNGSSTALETALNQLDDELQTLASTNTAPSSPTGISLPGGGQIIVPGTTPTDTPSDLPTSLPQTSLTSTTKTASPMGIQVWNPTTAIDVASQGLPLVNNAQNTAQYTTASLQPIVGLQNAQADEAAGTPVYWKNPQGELEVVTPGMSTVPGDRTLYTAAS